jgi:ribonuclease HI
MPDVQVYTDGACIGNPGPGGYGVILISGSHRKEFSGGFRLTTNNRMEILAAIVGMTNLKQSSKITLFSDSRYLVDAINLGWVKKWVAKGWVRTNKQPVENVDLWQQVLDQMARHTVEYTWVKGHATNPNNNRCDVLSVQAAKQRNLPADEAYERGETRKD